MKRLLLWAALLTAARWQRSGGAVVNLRCSAAAAAGSCLAALQGSNLLPVCWQLSRRRRLCGSAGGQLAWERERGVREDWCQAQLAP